MKKTFIAYWVLAIVIILIGMLSFVAGVPTAEETPTATPTTLPDFEPTPIPDTNCLRISFNINGFAVADWNYLKSLLTDLQPCTVLMMDDSKRALELMEILPDARIIFRRYHPSDGGQCFVESAEEQVNEFIRVFTEQSRELGIDESLFRSHLLLYGCSNEPSFGGNTALEAVIAKEIRFMQYARSQGVTVVSGNWAVGTIQPDQVEDGVFHDYLIALAEYGHYLGVHEYTTFFLPFGTGLYPSNCLVDPDCVQPENWVTASQIQPARWFPAQSADAVLPIGEEELAYYYNNISAQTTNGYLPPYWHLFRSLWLDIYALENGIPRPLKIVTEGLHDRLDDIDRVGPDDVHPLRMLQERYGIPEYMRDIRGAPSHCFLYTNFYYRGQSCSQSIMEQWAWWDSVADNTYLGVTIFTWSQNEHWETFNIDGTETSYDGFELHNLLRLYAAAH